MSGGPIDQARRGRLAPAASTRPTTATHYVGHEPRRAETAYCGRKRPAETTMWHSSVTCADCLAAMNADGLVSAVVTEVLEEPPPGP